MLFAEILVLFYLINSDCHAGRHNPLLHTFTGSNVSITGISSHETGFCHPYPKTIWIKAKIKSDVCVSYEIVILGFSSLSLF